MLHFCRPSLFSTATNEEPQDLWEQVFRLMALWSSSFFVKLDISYLVDAHGMYNCQHIGI